MQPSLSCLLPLVDRAMYTFLGDEYTANCSKTPQGAPRLGRPVSVTAHPNRSLFAGLCGGRGLDDSRPPPVPPQPAGRLVAGEMKIVA